MTNRPLIRNAAQVQAILRGATQFRVPVKPLPIMAGPQRMQTRGRNIDKHCADLESWRRVLADKVGVLRRNYSAFRLAEKYGMVTVHEPVEIVFHFERVRSELEVQA